MGIRVRHEAFYMGKAGHQSYDSLKKWIVGAVHLVHLILAVTIQKSQKRSYHPTHKRSLSMAKTKEPEYAHSGPVGVLRRAYA